MNRKTEILKFAEEKIDTYFNGGKGLYGVSMKNYTSGDHGQEGFEEIVGSILQKAISLCGIEERTKITSGFYICDPDGEFDNERLDHHIFVDDKLVMAVEDRAWVDKPFFTMKMGVIHRFKSMPFIKNISADNVKFIIVVLGLNLTEKTKKTAEYLYGELPEIVNLSGRKRGGNWFEHGYSKSEVEKLVDILLEVFEKYEEK